MVIAFIVCDNCDEDGYRKNGTLCKRCAGNGTLSGEFIEFDYFHRKDILEELNATKPE